VTPATADQPGISVALELAELRRSVDVGFARTDGQLNLLLQRADQTDARVAELDKRTNSRLEGLDKEVEDLKRGRWPLPTLGVLAGLAGAAAGLAALYQH
jgi:hypothetical protein